MAATETRLLLLGAVATFEPVNGYQIRRELLSWQVESWANIRPGSIYHGLASLAEGGELVRHDLRDGGREVAVYELSDLGRAEFRRLFEAAVTEVRPTAPLGFQTAMAILPLVARADALNLLGRRLEALDRAASEVPEDRDVSGAPPPVQAMVEYWEKLARVEPGTVLGLVLAATRSRLPSIGGCPTGDREQGNIDEAGVASRPRGGDGPRPARVRLRLSPRPRRARPAVCLG